MTEKITNPYLNARREWNERYGDYISRANSWRITAWVSLVIAFIAVFGIIGIGLQHKTVPYVVEVDRTGNAVAIGRAEVNDIASPKIIKALLARWVMDFRSVMVDASAQKQAVERVYAYLSQGDAASATIGEYFQKTANPFQRAQKELVSVAISSVLKISDQSWQIEWEETVRNRQGAQKGEPVRYKAVATLAFNPPTSEKAILKNPIGMYIKDIQWTTQL